MDKNTRQIINSLRRNGIRMSSTPVRDGENYMMVQYTNAEGKRMIKLVKKDEPLKEGEVVFDFEQFLKVWDENAMGEIPYTIDDEIDKIIEENNNLV